MTILKRPLGGWTRLWIAVTVLWLVVVVGGSRLLSDGPWKPYYVVAELGGHLDQALVQRISDTDRFRRGENLPRLGYDPATGRAILGYDPNSGQAVLEGPSYFDKFYQRSPTTGRRSLDEIFGTKLGHAAVEFAGRPVFLDPTHFTTEASLGELRVQLDRAYATERSIRWWSRVRGIFAVALLPPTALFIFGLTVGWIFRGFRSSRSTAIDG